MEPAFTIVDCFPPPRTPLRPLSALDSLCGRPLFMFAARASMQATKGPIWLRVPAGEQASYRAQAVVEPRLRVVDDVELIAELSGAASVLVICGYLPIETSEPLLRALAKGPHDSRNAWFGVSTADSLRRAVATGGELIERADPRPPSDAEEPLAPILDCRSLHAAETRRYAETQARLLGEGIVIHGNAFIDADAHIEPGAIIGNGVCLRGTTRVASRARIDVGSILTNVLVGPRAFVKPYTVASNAKIGEAAEVGPFSHLRDGSDIHRDARIGNFVETKNVVVRERAMANHLAYMGDGDVGEGANISAGTIFCNSDGVNKHRTEVGAGAFVGTDCQLVAPVKIGPGAFVATGTTVTEDVPADALAIGRAAQQNKSGYAPRLRAKFAAIAAERKKNPQ